MDYVVNSNHYYLRKGVVSFNEEISSRGHRPGRNFTGNPGDLLCPLEDAGAEPKAHPGDHQPEFLW
jgi:hypothetical protein